MKKLLVGLTLLTAMSSFATETPTKVCRYAGTFESLNSKVDYDPFWGGSEYLIRTRFLPDEQEKPFFLSSYPTLIKSAFIKDDELNQFVKIDTNNEVYPFASTSQFINVYTSISDDDFIIFGLFWSMWFAPMSDDIRINLDEIKWKKLSEDHVFADLFTEYGFIDMFNDSISLKLKFYRLCDMND